MLGLGWTEMLVIGVMALIFIGPKDLPVVMSRVGKIIGQLRRMGNEFQREINKTTGLDEVRNLRNSITSPLKKSADEIRKEFNAMTPTGAKPSGVIKPANPAAESVVDEIKAKAGMTAAAVPLSADEVAKAAGFKPAGPAPVTSKAAVGQPASTVARKAPAKAVKAPARAKAAPTSPVATSDLAPLAADPARQTAAKAPVASVAAAKSVPVRRATVTKPAATKPKVAKPAATAQVAEAPTAKPAARKRAPVKPTSETATITADKAGDN